MPIRDHDMQGNINDGNYPGLGGRIMKNAFGSTDPDPQFPIDGQYRFTFPDVPTGQGGTQTITIPIDGKCIIIGAGFLKQGGAGGAGDTLQAFNGAAIPANNITEAMNLNQPLNGIYYGTTINQANNVLQPGAVLTVVQTKISGSNAAADLYLNVMRSP